MPIISEKSLKIPVFLGINSRFFLYIPNRQKFMINFHSNNDR